MSKIAPFSKATEVPADSLSRGDVIVFKSQKTGEWQRGIVYNPVYSSSDDRLIGFRLLPVDTIGKNKKPSAEYPFLEKINADIVTQAGGNPHMQKTVVTFNIRLVANRPEMMGLDNKMAWKLGSYNGSPYMVELLEEVKKLYDSQSLYQNGKKIEPTTQITILPGSVAERDAKENSAGRRKAYQRIKEEKNTPATQTSISAQWEKKLNAMTLEGAAKHNYISKRSLDFLLDARMETEDRAPRTLVEAYRLVTETQQLSKVYGLQSKNSKMREQIVKEVTNAITLLKAPSNEGGPA